MKPFLTSIALFISLMAPCFAQTDKPVLNLNPGDVSLLQIELAPETTPKLVIFFSKAKLAELQAIITANYGKPVSFVSHGKVIVEPVIQSELLYKRRTVSLRFPDISSALKTAELLMPSK